MEAPYRYSSTRLPRDVSHLVKRSDLDALLRERPPGLLAWVSRTGRDLGSPAEYFRATAWKAFRPRSTPIGCRSARPAGFPWTLSALESEPGIWLSLCAVPAERRSELRALATSTVLPAVLDWAQAVVEGPETRRDLRPQAIWYLDRGALAHAEC